MRRGEMLYEGKAKQLYTCNLPDCYVMFYKDDATAFDGKKKAKISGKGALNNAISAIFFEMLQQAGVPTHHVRKLSENESLVRKVDLFPLEVIVRNLVAGSMAKRLGLQEGTPLRHPTVEFDYKSDPLGDPLVTEEQVAVLGWATEEEVDEMRRLALRVNDVLSADLLRRNVLLVDFKLEFGKDTDGQIVVADEISPDTCRFWDVQTHAKLDKDRFRRDMGGVEEAYQEMLHRLGGVLA
ncbi:MAG: phosphoribosylaminoimidazolesuccinocarboxamide synthase [Firmicutes bacterium]|nr:phosphoribosylaminoimidazolesuccinocarboxamide synthase [Bacillota bacterium]